MAERRMFAKQLIDSDLFLDMPLSTQALYFHLSMRADDDGFINNPKKIQRMIGSTDDDMKVLISKKFIIPFDSGIVVIKHWKIHNYIQRDRYKPTVYREEREQLTLKENNVYSLDTDCIQDGYSSDTQVSIGKDSIDKVSLGKTRLDKVSLYMSGIDEIIAYLNSKTHSNYSSKTSKYQDLIIQRLEEGYTVNDFYTVIDKKVTDWKGTDYEKFLTPNTLFGTKFDTYLNQKINLSKNKDVFEQVLEGDITIESTGNIDDSEDSESGLSIPF